MLFPVGMLLSKICGLVSIGRPLWREDGSAVCSVITQLSDSCRTCNHILLSRLRLPRTWRARFSYLYPPGTGWTAYNPGIGLFFCVLEVRSYFTNDSQSVSMSWYRVALRDLRPDITSSRNVGLWNLQPCFCGAPSLTRGRVCNLQSNRAVVRVAQNP
jgi:hypothetical protein